MKTTFAGRKSSRSFNQLSVGDLFTCGMEGDGLFIKYSDTAAIVITQRVASGNKPGDRCLWGTTSQVWPIEELTVKIKD